jgi:hypothetical protein
VRCLDLAGSSAVDHRGGAGRHGGLDPRPHLPLAKATDAYTKSAKDQVDELVAVRLATIQPRLHLVAAGVRGHPDELLVGLVIEVEVQNIGAGPAIDVVGRLHEVHRQINGGGGPETLRPGQSATLTFKVVDNLTPSGFNTDWRLAVEYGDLAGRRWIMAGRSLVGHGNPGWATDPLEISFNMHDETVKQIERPSEPAWTNSRTPEKAAGEGEHE